MTAVDTHCPYCALQCGMRVTGTRVEPRDFPVNRGGLCQKGWTAGRLLTSPHRLTTPLVRIDGELTPTDWATALDVGATRLLRLKAESGPDAIAVFGGGGLTNEKAYLLGKFARIAVGTSQVDYNGRFCMSSAAAAANRAFGVVIDAIAPLADDIVAGA